MHMISYLVYQLEYTHDLLLGLPAGIYTEKPNWSVSWDMYKKTYLVYLLSLTGIYR